MSDKTSLDQESTLAEQMDAFRQPASGAFDGMLGDVESNEFLVECKYTRKDIKRLKAKTVEKIEDEAFQMDRKPAIELRFEEISHFNRWFLVPNSVFWELLEETVEISVDDFELCFTTTGNRSVRIEREELEEISICDKIPRFCCDIKLVDDGRSLWVCFPTQAFIDYFK